MAVCCASATAWIVAYAIPARGRARTCDAVVAVPGDAGRRWCDAIRKAAMATSTETIEAAMSHVRAIHAEGATLDDYRAELEAR